MNYMKDNMSNAFMAACQANISLEKHAAFEFSPDDAFMEKRAGMPIYHPTYDNVETFVKKYIDNELHAVGKDEAASIDFSASSFSNAHSDEVSDGTGLIKIDVIGLTLEIPFMVHG